MNHLMKYEEIQWKDINPLDSSNILTYKFKRAISKINISGVKLEKCAENNKKYKSYRSKVKFNNTLDGCKSSEIVITNDSGIDSVICSMTSVFSNDNLLKMLNNSRIYIPYEVGLSSRLGRYFNTNDIMLTFKSTFIPGKKVTVEDLTKSISDNIEHLLNIDWKKIKESIDKQLLEIDIDNKNKEETNKKRQSVASKLDEISDLLIDLEDMSKSHKREVVGDAVNFIYEIPGIKVEETQYSKTTGRYDRHVEFTNDVAKIILTKELVDVMNAIEAFKKRLQDEAKDSEIKVHLKNDLVVIVLTLPQFKSTFRQS